MTATDPSAPAATPPAPRRAWPHVPRRMLAWAGGVLAVLALAWTLVLGTWLPGWLRPRIETAATQALGTPVRVAALAVQPWTLRVTLDGVSVGPQGAPLLAIEQAQARLSLRSVRHLAPVISGFTLKAPRLVIERTAPDRFNFSPVLDHLRAQPAAPDDGQPVRFALYNIRIDNGSVLYNDQVLRQSHHIEALHVGVPFVSNLPGDVAVEVEPLLEARIDGSPVRLSGQARPFAAGRPAVLQLDWRDVPLHDWAEALRPLLPPQSRVNVAEGRLDVALSLAFEQRPAPAVPLLRVQGRLGVRDLQAQWPQGRLGGRWHSLAIEGIDLTPLERRARLGAVLLDGLVLDQAGAGDAPRDGPTPPVPASAQPASAPGKDGTNQPGWSWSVGQVRVAASHVQLHPAEAAWPLLTALNLQAEGLNSSPTAAPAQVELTVADQHGSRVALSGSAWASASLPADADQARLDLQAEQLALAPWARALAGAQPLQVQAGVAAARAQLHLKDGRLLLEDGSLQLDDLRTAPAATAAKDDRLRWRRLAAQGLQLDVRLPKPGQAAGLAAARLAALTLDGLDLGLRRDAAGRWPLFMGPVGSASTSTSDMAATPAPVAGPAAAAPALTWALGELRCQGCAVSFTDEGSAPALRVGLDQAELRVRGASSDFTRPVQASLQARPQGRGSLRFDGRITPQPLAVEADVGVQSLDLRAVQPLLAPHVNLELVSAQASAAGKLKLAMRPAGPDVQWQGRVALADLRTQDGVTHNDFLRWGNLSLDRTDLAWRAGALRADLGTVGLSDFYGRVILHPDGHLNLQDIRKGAAPQSLTTPQPASAPAPRSATPPPTVAALPAAAASGPPMDVRWQAIRLTNGRLDFTDNFVRPNYSARMNRLQGEISAAASGSSEPARVELSGALDDGAPLRVTGRVNPLGPRLFADIEGTAQGIELTRLSTYAERYAGYAIDKGSLSVTVTYRIQDGQLQAQNRLFLDQLTFGQRVESPTATKLPVQLAVSLLKNSRGEIDVNLPVAGSLDDPQFSIGGVVLRLIGNLLLKAVTSPFSLLMGAAEALTGDHAEAAYVAFAPGSAELDEAAKKRLDDLAARLKDRPGLRLEATGRADPAVDADGLRQRHVDRALRAAKARATGAARARDVTVAPEERERWLADAYAAAELRKPRNLIGLPKKLPPAEMEALLKGEVATDDAALYTLADRRADAVNAYLAERLGADRVLLTRSRLGREGVAGADRAALVSFELK